MLTNETAKAYAEALIIAAGKKPAKNATYVANGKAVAFSSAWNGAGAQANPQVVATVCIATATHCVVGD